jgi:hypothetical protein
MRADKQVHGWRNHTNKVPVERYHSEHRPDAPVLGFLGCWIRAKLNAASRCDHWDAVMAVLVLRGQEKMPSYTVKRWLMCRLPCQGLGASRGKSEAPYTALDSVDEKMRCDARAWASGALRGTFDREEEGHEGSLPQDMGTLMATLSSPASIILVLPKQHEPRPSRRPRKPPSSLRLIQHTTRGCLGPVSSRPPALSPSRCVM